MTWMDIVWGVFLEKSSVLWEVKRGILLYSPKVKWGDINPNNFDLLLSLLFNKQAMSMRIAYPKFYAFSTIFFCKFNNFRLKNISYS